MVVDTEQKTYPKELYRGIPTEDWLFNGLVTMAAFDFKSVTNVSQNNAAFSEVSINWNDDPGALENLRDRIKTVDQGYMTLQFRYGYCVLNRETVDNDLKEFIQKDYFKYNRNCIEADPEHNIQANPYHGNLQMLDSLPKSLKNQIRGTLATIAGLAHKW